MGLSTDVLKPSGEAKVSGWARVVVDATLNAIIPGSNKKIQFVSPNRSVTAAVPMYEVKFRKREDALKLRREFGKLRKEKRYDANANCLTLGSRVCLEILNSIAKKCSRPNDEMFVRGFTSRLVL